VQGPRVDLAEVIDARVAQRLLEPLGHLRR
jgi:hypothetical protein